MKHRVILACALLSLLVLAAWAVQVQPTSAQVQTSSITIAGKSVTVTPAAVNNQTAVACNICFTCGGDWPVFAGMIRSSPNTPTERGSACAGSLISRTDASPFLCCR